MPPVPFIDRIESEVNSRTNSRSKPCSCDQTELGPTTQQLPVKRQLQDDFMKRNFIASRQARNTLGLTPRAVHPRTKDWIPLHSGKSCINIKVSLVITCIGGDIPAPAQLANMPIYTPHAQK